VESPASGILKEILAEPGSEVMVKSKIGVIAERGESFAAQPRSLGLPSQPGETNVQETTLHVVDVPDEMKSDKTGLDTGLLPSERPGRIFASPRARNLAKAEGVPLSEVKATGPQAMIVERDIRAYLDAHEAKPAVVRATPLAKRVAEATDVDLGAVAQATQGAVVQRADADAALYDRQTSAAQPLPTVTPVGLSGKGRPVALTALRKTIARRMQQSHQNTAPVTITREVDATEFVHLRASILKGLPVEQLRPAYTDFLVMILARTLPHHPNLNAHLKDDVLEIYDEMNIGLAVDSDRGLVVPVIHNVANKGLKNIAAERTHLVQSALAGTLSQEELNGGTFTITNLGPLGVDGFTPIINPPQVAILGVGRIRSMPAVFEEQISIRQVMVLSLTFDHRVIDGAPAARFLDEVTQLIEKPQLMWL
jgi:pyruvate dehydrogenase E2 component (dihydrolipoamide acetyltransferase)